MPRPTVELDVEVVVKETTMALLCRIDEKEIWIPKSLIGADSEVSAEGDRGKIEVPEWWALQNGLV